MALFLLFLFLFSLSQKENQLLFAIPRFLFFRFFFNINNKLFKEESGNFYFNLIETLIKLN